MRIAMIGHKRIPSREGGVEICVQELAIRMVEAGNEVYVYNRRQAGFKISEFQGARIINVPTIDNKYLDAVCSSFLATFHTIGRRFDVIHYHALGPSVMAFIPKKLGYRVVCTVHGLDWQRAKWGGFGKKYLQWGERIAAAYADSIIVLSRNMQQYFRDKYSRETIYIPNGVDQPEFRRASIINQKYGLTRDSYILFLARIVPEKGLHYLIEAYRNIDTQVRLVICGDESHSTDYLKQIKAMAGLDERIIMTGFVEGEELAEFYSNALVYILPSEVEGMPLSLLEAMSYGNCCLVSDIPEMTEVIQDNAVVFRSGDVSSLHKVLKELIVDRDRIQYFKNIAPVKILEEYSWDKTATRTLGEVYKGS